jgi:lysophospholipase L1-like esterase
MSVVTRHLAGLLPVLPLAPLLLWQGVAVRRKALRLQPAAGRGGLCGTGEPRYRMVGLGDSIIAGVGVERQTQSLLGRTAAHLHAATGQAIAWRARGFSGLTLRDVLDRLLPGAPAAQIYLISAGVNDTIARTQTDLFANQLATLSDRLSERSPGCRIVFAGIPSIGSFPALPWPLSQYLDHYGRRLQAAACSAAAERPALTCFEFPARLDPGGFSRDGFHPGAAGCDWWGREIAALLSGRPTAAPSIAV